MVSTDATGGFQCFMKKAIVEYLSQAHVRDAIHIPNYVPAYQKCRWVVELRFFAHLADFESQQLRDCLPEIEVRESPVFGASM